MTGHHHEHSAHDTGHHSHDDHDRHDDHASATGLRARLRHLVTPHSHDPALAMDRELETSRRGMRALLVSFLGLMVTALLQLIVFAVTGSIALLVDTIHNFADALTALPIAVAFTLGRRAATRRYTYTSAGPRTSRASWWSCSSPPQRRWRPMKPSVGSPTPTWWTT